METTHSTGLSVEHALIEYCDWKESSKEDNIHRDIDAWTRDDESVSIKYQPTCLKTGNVAFEVQLIDPKNNESIPSWFHTGEAEIYAFVIGYTLYEFNKKELRDTIIERNKDKKYRKTKLTSRARIDSNVGRKYSQSMCILVPLKSILSMAKTHTLDESFRGMLK